MHLRTPSARCLSRAQQRFIVVSALRLGAGLLAAAPLAQTATSGALGPWVLAWLLGSSTVLAIAAWLHLGFTFPSRTSRVDPWVEPTIAAVDLLAFTAVASLSPPGQGYGPVAMLGLVLLAQAPLSWGWRGALLVVVPLGVIAMACPADLAISSGGQLVLLAVIASFATLGLWVRSVLREQHALTGHVQATLSAVFDRSPTPAGITGANARLLHVNAALGRLCGCDADTLVGRRLLDLVHADDVLVLERVLASVLHDQPQAGEPGQALEVRLTGPGDWRWVRLLIGFVPASEGGPVQLVVQAEDVEERRATAARLEHEARHDALTGLPNRRAVHAELLRLTGCLESGERRSDATPGTGALVLIDLDGFKAVNDELGHPAGDELLIIAARRLEACLRDGESAGRLAGDELVVLADVVHGDAGARALGERVRSQLVGPALVGPDAVDLRASAGVTRTVDGDDPAAVLRRADDALYRAKRAGGGRLELAVTEEWPAHAGAVSR